MTEFAANRIDRPGTGEKAWRSWPGLRLLPLADPAAWPSVAVVAAHPDDEVLGAGGTMAILAGAGARLRLIAVTDGEGSHPGDDPAVIGPVRAAESAAALALLPIWMWHWAKPADPRVPWHQACRVPLPAGVAARKRAAIQAFASQFADRGPGVGPVLPPGIVAHFTSGQEVLLR